MTVTQRQPAHGIATARFRTPQPALPGSTANSSHPLRRDPDYARRWGPGRTGHRRVARRPAGGGELGLLGGTFRALLRRPIRSRKLRLVLWTEAGAARPERTCPKRCSEASSARRNPGRPLRLGATCSSSQACRRPSATWSSPGQTGLGGRLRPAAAVSLHPPRAQRRARRAGRQERLRRQLAAGRPGTPAPGPSQRPPARQPAKVGTASSSTYRRRTPAPVAESSPLGREAQEPPAEGMAGPSPRSRSSSRQRLRRGDEAQVMAPARGIDAAGGTEACPGTKVDVASRQAFSSGRSPAGRAARSIAGIAEPSCGASSSPACSRARA